MIVGTSLYPGIPCVREPVAKEAGHRQGYDGTVMVCTMVQSATLPRRPRYDDIDVKPYHGTDVRGFHCHYSCGEGAGSKDRFPHDITRSRS